MAAAWGGGYIRAVPAVTLADVRKIYPLGKTEVHAVNGVSFEIEEGDFVSIAGPSGSGKSTILNLIGCIDTPTAGTVEVMGTDTAGLGDRQVTDLRHRVLGFIFQSFNLVPVLNVAENVEFPLLIGQARVSKAELADEPTANLDSETGEQIIELMKRMNAELGTTFVFSTHDPAIVGIADHIVRLQDGLVVEDLKGGAGHGA